LLIPRKTGGMTFRRHFNLTKVTYVYDLYIRFSFRRNNNSVLANDAIYQKPLLNRQNT